jgi:transposase
MSRFIEGEARTQSLLFPEQLDDWVAEDNPVRVIDAFVEELDLRELGFEGAVPAETGRPGYHPATLLKIYIYGYLNRIQSSRRLEREAQRNVEVVWLTGRLMPDFKTIADFRKDNGPAIGKVCTRFIELCREMKLFTDAVVAIDGSKFKAVWEHEAVLEAMQRRLDRTPEASRLRRQTVEHPLGTLKSWMGSTHFLTKTLPRVRTEMSLHVLAYNLKRAMKILGTGPLMHAIRA